LPRRRALRPRDGRLEPPPPERLRAGRPRDRMGAAGRRQEASEKPASVEKELRAAPRELHQVRGPARGDRRRALAAPAARRARAAREEVSEVPSLPLLRVEVPELGREREAEEDGVQRASVDDRELDALAEDVLVRGRGRRETRGCEGDAGQVLGGKSRRE